MSRAARIRRDEALRALPKLEWDSSATFGSMPKRFISSAAIMAISAVASALGISFTWVSVMASTRWGSSSTFIAANRLAPFFRPTRFSM